MSPSTDPLWNVNIPEKVAGNVPKDNLLESLPGENRSRFEKLFENLNLDGIESWEEHQQQSEFF